MILYWVCFTEICPNEILYFGHHSIKFISLLEASKYRMKDICILNFSITNNTDGGHKDYWIEQNYINALSKHVNNLTDSIKFTKNPHLYKNWVGKPPSLMSLWNTLCIRPNNGGLYLHIGAYHSQYEYKTSDVTNSTIQWILNNRHLINHMSNNNEILVFHGIEASKIVNMWNALNINNSNLDSGVNTNQIIPHYIINRGKYFVQYENVLTEK